MIPPLAHFAGAFAPLEAIPLTAAAILYWHRATVLSWAGRPVPAWRLACFAAGLATIAVALFSPIGHIAEELVIAYMAWVFFEVAREGAEKQRLLDLARERGVPLDERRAQRAVAAGHAALLEERLMIAAGKRP